MEVKFNGEPLSAQIVTLKDLLVEKGLVDKTGIAVAVNGSVISKSKWDSILLQEKDEILIITAAAGG